MEIRNDAEALKALLGISSPGSAQSQQTRNAEMVAAQAVFGGDQATLSQAATEVSQSGADADVRTEKVAAIQQALAAGTYSVPAPKVADKVMDAMSTGGFGPTE